MDMGLKDKNAIICASSRGLGKGCALSLAAEGVNVTINGRNREILKKTVKDILSKHEVKVDMVCADITTKEGQNALYETCSNPDILVNNAGGPPPGDFRDWDREDWINACNANMFTPIEFIK